MGPFNLREPFCPMVNNTSGSTVGYKYFNFSHTSKARSHSLRMHIIPEGTDGLIKVLVGGPSESEGGREIACFTLSADMPCEMTELTEDCKGLHGLKGKQPLFFLFESKTEGKSLCKFYDFQFFCK